MSMHATRTRHRHPFHSCLLPAALAALLAGGAACAANAGVVASATGGGRYVIEGIPEIRFSFSAIRRGDGSAVGQFLHSLELGGLPIEFHGEVVCLTVDPVNGRAWIGGIVTQNNSEHPGFTTDIHQPGRDVWFRVLDSGEGRGEADRTTFLGFEGGAGIITSTEYCEVAPWPDDNARTNPVVKGNLQVRP